MHQKLFGKVLTFNPAKNVPIPLSKGTSVYFFKTVLFRSFRLEAESHNRVSLHYLFTMHISALERCKSVQGLKLGSARKGGDVSNPTSFLSNVDLHRLLRM